MTPVVDARGARMVIGDLGRYQVNPQRKARMPEVMEGLQRAIEWYEQGKVRPVLTPTVPFEAGALQRAFVDFLSGTNNVGKVVVKCRRDG